MALDMHKAYDHLEGDFLLKVLHRFVFAKHWVTIICACTSSCRFSIIFQGKAKGFFTLLGACVKVTLSPRAYSSLQRISYSVCLMPRYIVLRHSLLLWQSAPRTFFLPMTLFFSLVQKGEPS